jgi:AIPR protein
MVSNDRIILDEVLKQRQVEVDPEASTSGFFELFSAEQILKDFDLSYEEIESGLVGDGGDGGIDGIYLFVNGELVQEDADYAHLRRNISLDLFIIQSKTSLGFQETPIERFITASDDIFDLSKQLSDLRSVYNERLMEAVERFRDVYQELAAKFPTLRVSFFYACKGANPDGNVRRKVDKLRTAVAKYFPTAGFEFSFLGATELLALARRAPQTTYSLTLAESPVSSGGRVGFVCLVSLRDFFEFITDENSHLNRQIFEANVRDYQGRTEVNDEIQDSLKANNPEDFWWLNNGVTVLATKASLTGKMLTIEDPQIVNGLQTSTEIFNYYAQLSTGGDDRNVLVRVVVPSESASRDRIIKATNSQTAVQRASLRATDKIHRDIEEYLRPRGLFYDRRKNYYKNEDKPRDRIVGIPHLAQAVMAIVLMRPDTARARPSSLLKKDEDYAKVYSPDYPIQVYFVCADAMRRVEAFLKPPACALPAADRNNLRFYVAMHAVGALVTGSSQSPTAVATVDIAKLDEARIGVSLDFVKAKYDMLGGTDQVAKGPELLEALLK